MRVAAIVFVIVALLASAGVFVLQKRVEDRPVSLAAFARPPAGAVRASSSMSPDENSASSSSISYWREKITTMGAKEAYDYFVEGMQALNPAEQHVQAHIFGTALYRERGDAGFPICGNVFSFGCAHAVIAAALEEDGVGAIPGFAEACAAASWPVMCYHGIGHGLIRAVGHSEESARKAMNLCVGSVHDASTPGCIGGVIMEYNGQTMVGGSVDIRKQAKTNIYEPCLSAPRETKSACYFWMVSWWYDNAYVHSRELASVFSEVGNLCEAMPEIEYLPQCLAGLGVMAAATAGYTPQPSQTYCEAATENLEHQMYCKAYAGNILLETREGETGIRSLCASTGDFENRCRFLAHRGVSVFD